MVGLVKVDFFLNGTALDHETLDVNVGAMNLLPRLRNQLTDVVVNLVKMLLPLLGVVNGRMNLSKKVQKFVILFEFVHQLCAF
jgi:hypothetical protein